MLTEIRSDAESREAPETATRSGHKLSDWENPFGSRPDPILNAGTATGEPASPFLNMEGWLEQ